MYLTFSYVFSTFHLSFRRCDIFPCCSSVDIFICSRVGCRLTSAMSLIALLSSSFVPAYQSLKQKITFSDMKIKCFRCECRVVSNIKEIVGKNTRSFVRIVCHIRSADLTSNDINWKASDERNPWPFLMIVTTMRLRKLSPINDFVVNFSFALRITFFFWKFAGKIYATSKDYVNWRRTRYRSSSRRKHSKTSLCYWRISIGCCLSVVHEWWNGHWCNRQWTGKLISTFQKHSICRFRSLNSSIYFEPIQEIKNVTRIFQNTSVKCQAQNIIGANADVATLDVICTYSYF